MKVDMQFKTKLLLVVLLAAAILFCFHTSKIINRYLQREMIQSSFAIRNESLMLPVIQLLIENPYPKMESPKYETYVDATVKESG